MGGAAISQPHPSATFQSEKEGGTTRREAFWAAERETETWTNVGRKAEQSDQKRRKRRNRSPNTWRLGDERQLPSRPQWPPFSTHRPREMPSLPPSSVHLSIHLSVRSLTQNKVLPSPPAAWRVSAGVAPPPTSLLLPAAVAAAATASREAGSKPCSAPSASASIFTLSARKAE